MMKAFSTQRKEIQRNYIRHYVRAVLEATLVVYCSDGAGGSTIAAGARHGSGRRAGGGGGGGEGVCRTVDKPRDPDRSRDLFGVQLEVTSLLLEAERRKLWVLQRELQAALAEGGSIKAKEHQRQELLLAISRIQAQHDHLEKEYEQHAIGVLRCSNTRGSGKSNRSQPAIGLKQTPKARPTIFGTVASDQTPKDGSSRRGRAVYLPVIN
ncbi:uncharacterized protein LOC126147901 [Schistocerca cancellata]|uniref:uncharacterized protein LOC126147901 n=1 Tax=Schistocerca cancellata TaxID=274614 RepID=UPI002117C504|nr:uncharacterized protein LOC126147901 [Schistocerca cancellata]